jgi:hypothetical protein
MFPMASWSGVASAASELAAAVRNRFDAHGLGLIATLRRDGSPRISGVEPLFTDQELWLGMMPKSLKAADLMRDPRLALHAATADKDVTQGDAKLAGRAVAAEDEATFSRYRAAFLAATGSAPPEGAMHLFRVDVTEVSMLHPAGDHLVIEWWREGQGLRRVERR